VSRTAPTLWWLGALTLAAKLMDDVRPDFAFEGDLEDQLLAALDDPWRGFLIDPPTELRKGRHAPFTIDAPYASAPAAVVPQRSPSSRPATAGAAGAARFRTPSSPPRTSGSAAAAAASPFQRRYTSSNGTPLQFERSPTPPRPAQQLTRSPRVTRSQLRARLSSPDLAALSLRSSATQSVR